MWLPWVLLHFKWPSSPYDLLPERVDGINVFEEDFQEEGLKNISPDRITKIGRSMLMNFLHHLTLMFLSVIFPTGVMFEWWICCLLSLKIALTVMLSKNGWGKSLALDLVSSHPWDEVILVTAAVTQGIISHLMSYTYHVFRAKPLRA